MNKPVVQLFDVPELNKISSRLIELDEEYAEHIKEAKQSLFSAFKTRWLYGKIISENMELILEECGTQKKFADKIGKAEGVISNNKRGYEYLKEAGCKNWDDVLNTLKRKRIRPTVSNFEKIGTLLNDPDGKTGREEQISKDRRRLEQLRGEAEEILRRNEPGSKPELIEDAFEFIEDIDDIKNYLDSFNPKRTGWKSEKYLDFVRNFGFDVITGEPCEKCDPHHTDLYGGSGSTGDKLPDTWAIPVSRRTHMLLEEGRLEVKPLVMAKALIKTLMAFVQYNLK